MTTSPFDADRPPEPARRRRRRRGADTGRRRPDPTLMVPDAVVEPAPVHDGTSYYGRAVVKPVPWKHEIPAYLFVGGLAGGSGLIGCWAHALGLETLRRNSRYAAMAGVAVSGALLVADLGHPERFLNMMRTIKVTSPMSVGSWILTGFAGFASLATAAELGGALGIGSPGTRLGLARRSVGVLGSGGTALFATPLVTYTGVLLSDTATPTWHAAYRELPWVFGFSAAAASSGLAMLSTPVNQAAGPRTLAVIAAAAETVASRRMQTSLGPLLAEPLHHGTAGRLHTAATALTVAGAAGAALLGGRRWGAAVSGLALMAGSVCTRFSVFEAGIHSAEDPKYTMLPQRQRVEERHARGDGSTDITTAR